MTRRLQGRGRAVLLLAGLAVLALGLAAWWLLSSRRAAAALMASGTLEADQVLISPQVTAAITALPAPLGSEVAAGTVLARLDDTAVQLQIQQAADPATLRTYQVQDQQYTLRAPAPGIISQEPAHVGETALPGAVLLVLTSNLDALKLTLYVREADLPSVAIGQPLIIVADPLPDQRFSGVVTSINTQAEFTPRNVQTADDRLNLVYGVQASVPNPDRRLKPGMPVRAQFETVGAP